MSDEEKPKKHGADPLVVGRRSKKEAFPVVRTPEDVVAVNELQKKYDDPNSVPLSAYFAIRRISNPVKKAAMEAYTKVRKATVAAFDDIFKTF